MNVNKNNYTELAWDKMDGLIPVVVQHQFSGLVLMQGYMSQEAIEKTFDSGLVTFYSRSKQRLWTKGEASGNHLKLISLAADCDSDCLIAMAEPVGPTCHLGTDSCWANDAKSDLSFIAELEEVIKSRKGQDPTTSYTASLYDKGIKRIAQKVGEEGVETALAAATGDIEELKNESADLLYHLLVLLQSCDLELNDVIKVLKNRHK